MIPAIPSVSASANSSARGSQDGNSISLGGSGDILLGSSKGPPWWGIALGLAVAFVLWKKFK